MDALNEKIIEALHESSDKFKTWKTHNLIKISKSKTFNSIFQVPQQQEEPTDLEKSIEFMIQSQMIIFNPKMIPSIG